MGRPPVSGLKKLVAKVRSNINSIRAIVMAGKARMIKKLVINVIQVNTGKRIICMPGARMLMIVVMKLKEAASEAMPSTCKPRIQKSAPMPGLYLVEVSGA